MMDIAAPLALASWLHRHGHDGASVAAAAVAAARAAWRLAGAVGVRGRGRRTPSTSGVPLRAVVTGAAGGIGRAVAEELARRGWHVVACDVSREGLDLLAKSCGANLTTVVLDVTDEAQCARLADDVSRDGASVHALVNVAGLSQPGPVMGFDERAMRRLFDVNAFGAMRLVRLLMPALLRSPLGGNVVNVSSTNARSAWPWSGYYAPTKAALELFADILRREAVANGLTLRVTNVAPGAVRTPLMDAYTDKLVAWARSNADSPFQPACHAAAQRQVHLRERGFPQWLFAVSPDAVAAACVDAVEAAHPPARVLVATPIFAALFHADLWLPKWITDTVLGSM